MDEDGKTKNVDSKDVPGGINKNPAQKNDRDKKIKKNILPPDSEPTQNK